MPLGPGARLGPYLIGATLGAGGMGEVYRATDTKLKRQVAIKVLPQSVACDPERLARFQREAEVLAALNHPHIAAIHGLDETDGLKALVMELVEGPTLADRIAHGPIPVEEALPIARQIAEALEAAHELGIVHRDLKPANIKVRDDGTVKVLDFGLAKAMETGVGRRESGAGDTLANSPTLTSPAMTQAGVILGTAAYMSPEQAKGKPVDRRADIWAFGCVLYEMLTGRRAFDGEDVTDTIVAVLSHEPEWERLPSALSPAVRVTLQRCLQKPPKQRLADLQDVRLALDGAFTVPDMAAARDADVARVRAWQRPEAIAAMVLVAAALAVAAVWRPAPPSMSGPTLRLVLPDDDVVPLANSSVAISPDGSHLVYAGTTSDSDVPSLYLRALDRSDSTRIPGTERASSPFFSPDGQWIGFVESGAALMRVQVQGGTPVSVATLNRNAVGVTWIQGDRIVAGSSDGLIGVDAVSGQQTPVTALDVERGEWMHINPSPLPDPDAALFQLVSRTGTTLSSELAVVRFSTGEVSRLGVAGGCPHLLPSGHLVYQAASEDGWATVKFDANRLEALGAPTTLDEGLPTMSEGCSQVGWGVSAAGDLAYVGGTRDAPLPRASLVWVDRAGKVLARILAGEAFYGWPRLSPDGDRVAIAISSGIWIRDLRRGTEMRLNRRGHSPVWSPDGRRLTFMEPLGRPPGLYSMPADASRPPEVFLEGTQMADGAWSPDGRAFVFVRVSPSTQRDIWVRPTEGSPQPFLATPYNEFSPRVSPDGRWVAYVTDQTGENRVFVQPFPGGGAPVPVSTGPGTEPVWSRDGRELFYRSDEALMAAPVRATEVFDVETPAALVPASAMRRPRLLNLSFNGPGEASAPSYDVSLDGRQFLFVLPDDDDGTGGQASETRPQIHVVVNWLERLERLVPTGR